MKGNDMVMPYKNILRLALVVAAILLVPLVATQFSDDMDWSIFDFVAAGALLFGAGLAYLLVANKADTMEYRAGAAVALGTALMLLWVNLAVGIVGSEDNPINALYLGVLGVLVLGALFAQLRPRGMAIALFATAVAQAVVTVIALLTQSNPEVIEVLLINGFFGGLWIGAALLFQRAAAGGNRRAL